MNPKSNLINLFLYTVLFSLSLASYAGGSDQQDLWQPPGELISVGTHRLHIFCQGEENDQPTVIIDSGLGGFSLEWRELQNELSQKFRICSYDRAGYGWSDPGPFPRTTSTIVSELRVLLRSAEVSPPYMLIGHSFGGYNMMYFAKTFPDELAGLLLIDSSHPDQANWFPSVFPDLAHGRRRSRFVSIPKLPANYPFDYRNTAFHLMSAKKARNALRFESMNFEISGNQVARKGSLPSIPLVVLTRGERAWPDTREGEQMETNWIRLQNQLARMSSNSSHVMADFSGHFIHLDQPDLVKDAIIKIVGKGSCSKKQVVYYAELKEESAISDAGEC